MHVTKRLLKSLSRFGSLVALGPWRGLWGLLKRKVTESEPQTYLGEISGMLTVWDEVVMMTIWSLVWYDSVYLLCCSKWKNKHFVWGLNLLMYSWTRLKVDTKMSTGWGVALFLTLILRFIKVLFFNMAFGI